MAVSLPPPVRPGDRVGVAALSGIVDGERLDRGLAALVALGFEPVEAANLRRRWGMFAGDDDERLASFHQLASDPSLGAIFFARGGYGLMRLLPRLDWPLLARTPRAYVGYSDVTPFLLQVVARLGRVAYHGPMVATDLARGLQPAEAESLLAALAGAPPAPLPAPLALRGGVARGPLLGGCLSLLAATVGTPWLPPLAGAVLFLEDIDEPEYRIDRMLTHLGLSGTLSHVHGTVVGHLGRGWEQGPAAAWQRQSLLATPGPVSFGLPVGHGVPNHTLPLGREAVLDADRGELRFD